MSLLRYSKKFKKNQPLIVQEVLILNKKQNAVASGTSGELNRPPVNPLKPITSHGYFAVDSEDGSY